MVTPLIAVDELPSYVQIHRVPQTLTATDTNGLISLGLSRNISTILNGQKGGITTTL